MEHGFCTGYVGSHDELGVIVDRLELLIANMLCPLTD